MRASEKTSSSDGCGRIALGPYSCLVTRMGGGLERGRPKLGLCGASSHRGNLMREQTLMINFYDSQYYPAQQ
jgi:hypothetical protein